MGANRNKERQLLANRKQGMVNISHQAVGRQLSANQLQELQKSAPNVDFVSESKAHVQGYTLQQNSVSETPGQQQQVHLNQGGNSTRTSGGTSGQIYMTADGQQVILPRQMNIQSQQRFKQVNSQSMRSNPQSVQHVIRSSGQPVRVDGPNMQRLINERLSQAANQQQRQRVMNRQQEHNNQITLAQRLQRTNQPQAQMTLQQQQEMLKKRKQNME